MMPETRIKLLTLGIELTSLVSKEKFIPLTSWESLLLKDLIQQLSHYISRMEGEPYA
jgi:hypothetical protein